MFNRSVFVLAAVAVLAISITAQSHSIPAGPNESVRISSLEADLTRFLESDDDTPDPITRPRKVNVKTSGVKSSVIINTLSLEREAFKILNRTRAEKGESPLIWNEQLAAVARLHSGNMAEYNFFSHRGLDGKMVSSRADDAGVGKWRSIGENIAFSRGYGDPVAKAVQLWLDSPAHRQNLLDVNWKEAAVGVAAAPDGSYYFTQVFLRR
jgi:uncharacterized protein YkwD